MIGIIVTAHGAFAPGIVSAGEMIAGPQEKLKVVPFQPSDSAEILTKNITNAFTELTKTTDAVLILTDLVGGSPFKIAATLTQNNDKADVLGGVNLAILLEALIGRITTNDLEKVVSACIQTAQTSVLSVASLEKQQVVEDTSIEEDEGI